jgi:uncharacterized FlgJ-related protein
MHKLLFLLIIPIAFTYCFDFSIYSLNNELNNQLRSTLPKNKIINVHEDFDYNLTASSINDMYFEKTILNHEDRNNDKYIYISKLNENLDKYHLLELKKFNSLQLISSGWEKKFSNKKVKFIQTLLPLIAYQNEKILIQRKNILDIQYLLETKRTLTNKNIKYINELAEKYNLRSKNKHKIDLINELLISVNIIPNSIVLAQAANESGWGTSRFAKEYNALFGQYTYDANDGVIPNKRDEGKKHLIKNFSSFEKSVESYFRNINSHDAYEKFRQIRSRIHPKDLRSNIKLLTHALEVYAEDKSYVETINLIIDSNKLNQFDLDFRFFINS